MTDLKECTRITLPKPLPTEEEAKLEIRKNTQLQIFRDYMNKNTRKGGQLETNLTTEEQEGLKSLQKRVQEGKIIVLKTDKSSKFAVTNQQEYLNMGQEHVAKDRVITRQELIQIEENLNGHNRAGAGIWGSGKDHDHFGRILASKTTHSENVANLYLMYKDHKAGNKTRPTATGHSSNSLGLSNAVREILEAIASSEDHRYNTISSEDMLSRMHKFNKKILDKNNVIETESKKVGHPEDNIENKQNEDPQELNTNNTKNRNNSKEAELREVDQPKE